MAMDGTVVGKERLNHRKIFGIPSMGQINPEIYIEFLYFAILLFFSLTVYLACLFFCLVKGEKKGINRIVRYE